MMLAFETSIALLEIPETIHTQAWQQSEAIALPGQRWQVYLNQVCLETALLWFREKSDSEPIVELGDQPGFWEIINGSAVTLGEIRVVLIPTEAMDRSELRVPQEWVDIPSWVADYYLAVEVDADEQVLQIWGYATHHRLKTQGQYDGDDRTYSLIEDQLIQDLTVFWVMQQLPPEPTRAIVPSLAELTPTQAENLIARLGTTSIILPRLEAPFAQWGALLQQGSWRERLREHRQTSAQSRPVQPLVNLSQWLENAFETGWQAIETALGSEADLAFNFRRDEATELTTQRVKRLQLGAEFPDVLLIVRVSVEADDRRLIWVQLLPQMRGTVLPENVHLALRSTGGDVLQSVQAGSQSNYIQLRRFRCAPGTAFRVEATIAHVSVVEMIVS